MIGGQKRLKYTARLILFRLRKNPRLHTGEAQKYRTRKKAELVKNPGLTPVSTGQTSEALADMDKTRV